MKTKYMKVLLTEEQLRAVADCHISAIECDIPGGIPGNVSPVQAIEKWQKHRPNYAAREIMSETGMGVSRECAERDAASGIELHDLDVAILEQLQKAEPHDPDTLVINVPIEVRKKVNAIGKRHGLTGEYLLKRMIEELARGMLKPDESFIEESAELYSGEKARAA